MPLIADNRSKLIADIAMSLTVRPEIKDPIQPESVGLIPRELDLIAGDDERRSLAARGRLHLDELERAIGRERQDVVAESVIRLSVKGDEGGYRYQVEAFGRGGSP